MGRKRYTVEFRRKREQKTNYNSRMKLLSSQKPRLVVRKSIANVSAQIVTYGEKGDKVVVSANTRELRKLGWKYHGGNTPSAYLVGLLIAKKAFAKKIKEAILDIGPHKSNKECSVYAVVKGAITAGLKIPHNDKILPSDSRIKGETIANYAKELSKTPEKYKKQFSGYIKQGLKPEDITKHFDETKKKIGV